MAIAVETTHNTGQAFIDHSHPIIAAYVNAICEELSDGKEVRYILDMVKSLQNQMDTYITSKSLCCNTYNCGTTANAQRAKETLDDLYLVFAKYAQIIPREQAIQDICNWAMQAIFHNDLKCLNCTKKTTQLS